MKTVFFDIDTQIDFLFPAGALYVPDAERIVSKLVQLNRFAGQHGIPLVSTMCAHTENDPEFQEWPPHCVVGTVGQLKPTQTLLENRMVVPYQTMVFTIQNPEQILLEKRKLNLFTNPNLPQLLNQLAADRYVVYGVVTEYCVRFAALGLLERGQPVSLVADAIQGLSEESSARTLKEFQERGGKLTATAEICLEKL